MLETCQTMPTHGFSGTDPASTLMTSQRALIVFSNGPFVDTKTQGRREDCFS